MGARLARSAAVLFLGAAGMFGPPELLQHLTVFLLACVVGWHVVWNVTPALHTPLMSVTNAISGIILIGGMLVVAAGAGTGALAGVAAILGGVAILLASINVAGGFLVTQRMLRMFRK
jgi:NAD(P) transhydrogenase subunit alpha